MDNRTLSKRLRAVRVVAGLSQEDLAAQIGLDGTAVSKIEKNKRRLRADEFARWCEACGTTTNAVIDGSPIAHPEEAAS